MRAPRKKDAAPAPESDALGGAPHPRKTYRLIGHGAGEAAMLSAYKAGRLPHAWLICGREGVGKATLAWRMARFLMAHPDARLPAVQNAVDLFVDPEHRAARMLEAMSSPDLVLLRRQWNDQTDKFRTEIRVEDARAALHMFQHQSASDGWRICIVDAADDLNRASANALLKLIEEPPTRSVFFLIAHQPGRLLPTIRSRCRRLDLEPLSTADVAEVLRGMEPPVVSDEKLIARVAEASEGAPRRALRLALRQGAASLEKLDEILRRLPNVDWKSVLGLMDELAKAQNERDYEAFLDHIFEWLDGRARAAAGQGAFAAAPYAAAWEKITEDARATEIYNLDKKTFILGAIEDLASAAAGKI